MLREASYLSPSCFLPSLKLKSLSFSLVSSVWFLQNHWSWKLDTFFFFSFRFLRFSTSELSQSLELEFETFFLVSFLNFFLTISSSELELSLELSIVSLPAAFFFFFCTVFFFGCSQSKVDVSSTFFLDLAYFTFFFFTFSSVLDVSTDVSTAFFFAFVFFFFLLPLSRSSSESSELQETNAYSENQMIGDVLHYNYITHLHHAFT